MENGKGVLIYWFDLPYTCTLAQTDIALVHNKIGERRVPLNTDWGGVLGGGISFLPKALKRLVYDS